MTNIEILQTQVNQVKTDLDALKKETSETVKKNKVEDLKKNAESTKEKINKKIDELKGFTDANSKADIVKLEAMLKTLENSDSELEMLKIAVTNEKDIIAPIEDKTKNPEKKEENPEEKKEPEEKKNRFKRQRDGFSDTTEENHILKNATRIAGGIVAVGLVYKGIKRLFGGDKKKEENKEGENNKTEEPGFWKSRFGKFLKWTGIGTGAYYLTHGLVTGRWNLKDFFNRDNKNETNPGDIKDRYEKEIPAELKPKYEKFGNIVDDYRKGLKNTDSLGTLEDVNNKEVIIPKGCIPALMDDAYDNVGDMLDPSNYIDDRRSDIGGNLRDKVTSLGGKVAGYLFKPLIGIVKGLTSTMFGSDGQPNEEFKKWAEKQDLTRDEQIANLMKKYSMVQTYLGDKKSQLAKKYIIDYLKAKGNNNPTEEQIEDAIKDDVVEEYVNTKLEENFSKKKIADIKDENSVLFTLEAAGMYDKNAGDGVERLAEDVTQRKKEIVPDLSVFGRAMEIADINKDVNIKKELSDISDRFGKYLNKGFLQRNLFEAMANFFGIFNFDELWNGRADDIEEVMETLGFNDEIKRFKKENTDFMIKLTDGTLTKQDISDFQKTIDGYFNTEQDILLAAERKNNDESTGENRIWMRTKGRGLKLVTTGGGITILVSTVAYVGSKRIRTRVDKKATVALNEIKGITINPLVRRRNAPNILGMNKWMKLKAYGEDSKYYDNLMNDFTKGRIDATIAEGVFNRRAEKWGKTTFYKAIEDKLKLTQIGNLKAEDQAKLIAKYFNGDLRKLGKTSSFNFSLLAKELSGYEKKVLSGSLAGDKLEFFQDLFAKAKFTKIDDIARLTNSIDNIDITGLSPKELKKITKELGKDISNLKDAKDINAKIAEIKKGINAVNELTDAQKNIVNLIDQDIVELTEFMRKDMIKMPGYTPNASIDIHYTSQLDHLKEFKYKIKGFGPEEITAFNTLRKLEFKSHHIIELLELKKPGSAIESVLEKIANNEGSIEDLGNVLKSEKNAGKEISETLLKTVEDIHLKNAVKSLELAENLAKIFKFIAKVS